MVTYTVNAAVVAGGRLGTLGFLRHRLGGELATGRTQLALRVALGGVRVAVVLPGGGVGDGEEKKGGENVRLSR